MNRDQRIIEEAEKTLGALDNLPKLEANPYLVTRLHASLAEGKISWSRMVVRNPWMKPAALAFFILLNIFAIFGILETRNVESPREELISALRQEYDSNQ